MIRERRCASIGMTIKNMASLLPHGNKTQAEQEFLHRAEIDNR
jgi:hypothetical protein